MSARQLIRAIFVVTCLCGVARSLVSLPQAEADFPGWLFLLGASYVGGGIATWTILDDGRPYDQEDDMIAAMFFWPAFVLVLAIIGLLSVLASPGRAANASGSSEQRRRKEEGRPDGIE